MRGLSRAAILICCLALATPSLGAKHEKWFEARSQNFIVVCNAGDKQARKTAVQFEQIRALFGKYLPITANDTGHVITIVAAKDENSMRELLPEYWAKGHSHVAGLFFGGLDQQLIAVQVDAPGENPYAVIYHEYYHSLTVPYFPGFPLWAAEGLADFFGNSRVEGQKAYMGEPSGGRLAELQQSPLIPLKVLFNVDRTSPYYNEAQKTGVFYAESWALTHYLMMADHDSHRATFGAYLVAAMQKGTTQDEAAAKTFGDLKKLQIALEEYIRQNDYYRLEAPAPAIEETDVHVRELTDAEADAYLGGFTAYRRRPQDAKPLLEEAIKLDPNLALAYQNLGVTQYFEGDRSAALESFSKAVSLDPKNALTHYFRAYLSLGQDSGAADDPQFDSDLRQAIALDPNFAPPYSLLAMQLARSNDKLPEALALAKQAVKLEPGRSSALLTFGQILVRMQRFDDAQTVGQWAQKDATGPRERQSADQFVEYVQRMRSIAAEEGRPNVGPPSARAQTDDVDDDSTSQRPSKPSSEQHAIGVVTQSSCVGGSPQIGLQTSSGKIVLHVAPGTSLNITLSFNPPPGFNPCSSFKGYRAAASYTLDDPQGARGTLTALRILGPADADDAGGTSTEDSERATQPQGSLEDSRAPGSPARAEGQVADVTCNGNEMLIKIAAAQRKLTLHARDYTRLTYYDDHSGPSSNGYAPCTDLTGHTVSIIFVVTEHRRYDGEMQSVEIEK